MVSKVGPVLVDMNVVMLLDFASLPFVQITLAVTFFRLGSKVSLTKASSTV